MDETLDILPGEGKEETIKHIRLRRECEECGEPAHYQITFLYENARTNPASSGYRGDDISYCSDREIFACKEHKDDIRRNPPVGMSWCATFSASARFAHLFLYWKELKTEEM